MFASNLPVKISVLANTLLVGLFSANVNAALTSYTNNGADLVYSSVSNVTWTKDANLLGTLIAADSNVIQSIVNASTNNYGSYAYAVTASDFSSSDFGRTTWYGANAFISYLNSISYGGSSSWRLPTEVTADGGFNGYNKPNNGSVPGDELNELYYNELGGTATLDMYGSRVPDKGFDDPGNIFNNEQKYIYWSGSERGLYPLYSSLPDYSYATYYEFTDGWTGYQGIAPKWLPAYTWAVTTGNISAVPAPAAIWLFATGLPMIAAACRRRKQII